MFSRSLAILCSRNPVVGGRVLFVTSPLIRSQSSTYRVFLTAKESVGMLVIVVVVTLRHVPISSSSSRRLFQSPKLVADHTNPA